MSRRRDEASPDHTVIAIGTVRPGSSLDRLSTHGECLVPGCGQQVDAPYALCAAHHGPAWDER